MKKLIYLMAFVLTTLLTVSCSSDDDGGSTSSDPIVGNWKNTGIIIDGTFIPEENEPCEEVFFKFSSNGTGKITEEDCEGPSDITNFTWEKENGSNYYVTNEFGEGGVSNIEFSDNNNKMTIPSVDSPNDGAVFQRQ